MHDIMVIGGSAGGVEAVASLVRQLPADLPAALFVVIHFPPQATSVLPHLLTRAGALPAQHATDGDRIEPGQIYIAPPDWHMLVREGVIELARGPRENRHRPAIDPLFRSAALSYGARVVGVLLSGLQADGSAGLEAIKARGGVTVCQDPGTALYPDMPRNAMELVEVHYALPLEEMGGLLVRLSREEHMTSNSDALMKRLAQETEIAALNWDSLSDRHPPGKPSAFGCPSCGGVLWEAEGRGASRFRCRVGHAYSGDDLLDSQENAVEEALWSAMRALEERASLLSRMAERARTANRAHAARQLDAQRDEARQRAALLQRVISSGGITALEQAVDS